VQRRSILAALLAILLAPFVRFFERFWPKPKKLPFDGTSECVDFGKVVGFDANEPFSVSMWFKYPNGKLGAMPACTTKISETTLLDDVTDDEWHTFSATYDGFKDEKPKVFIDGLPEGEKLPPGTVQLWKGSPDVAGDDTQGQVAELLPSGDGVEPSTSLPPAVG